MTNDQLHSLIADALIVDGASREMKFHEAAEALRVEMELLASKMKDIVLSQPPQDLLGYLWAGLFLASLRASATDRTAEAQAEGEHNSLLIAMEYVHAVLSCFGRPKEPAVFSEACAKEMLSLAERIKAVTALYCIASSRPGNRTEFGDETGRIEFLAKSTWSHIRGNRYQVLEEEFFRFILKPHDAALRCAYGNGADDIAIGIQAIANAMRAGFARAAEQLASQSEATHRVAEERQISLETAIGEVCAENPEVATVLRNIHRDMFRGGVCNLSRHTSLPVALLEDLSFEPGENAEFFEPGAFCGTLLRTFPARIKPLIRLDDGFYATDPQFVRDAMYRAVQRGVLTRLPGYREEWNRRQKTLTESAFPTIFCDQLRDASVLTEVYYRDPISGQWLENDTLILIDDVLLLVEAKAGIAAMHSPATSFQNHVRAIQELVVKAYRQTKRFFEYLHSAPEVPLFELRDGQHIEVRRLRLADFRLMVPVGLTAESFAPFSAMCKRLPEIAPLLGQHPFVSMAIDDLFVLTRFLATTGALFHYLEVRQQVAAIRDAQLFDEMDHLGAYIANNRFDITIREQLAKGANEVIWDGLSAEIDQYFSGDRWLRQAPPAQTFPDDVVQVLAALAKTRARGWLKFDALIRDFSSDARAKLGRILGELASSLREFPRRWLLLTGEQPMLIWLQRNEIPLNCDAVLRQAEIAALATKSREIPSLSVSVDRAGHFLAAQGSSVTTPELSRKDYQDLLTGAEALHSRLIAAIPPRSNQTLTTRLGRNEPCWCGSGRKFKKCHGSSARG